ncbi:MAG: ABC transporter permease [Rubritepida sp.]|jgi:phospholipid/cholesterol/gamma-HCH transport system permease protein|nr:ABC transporter permease [Rubritepida sp.]
MLAAIGRPLRLSARTLLHQLALVARLLALVPQPDAWSPATRRELFRRLRQALLGGLAATIVIGLLVGLGLIFQAIALAGATGQEALLADVLVRVLVRELAPALIGLLILGRTGLVIVAELVGLRESGALRALELQGVDPLRLLTLPAALACAMAGFTLGVLFVAVALLSGGALAWLLGSGQFALLDSLNDVLGAMQPADIVIFPAKLVLAGLLVGAVAAYSALAAPAHADAASVLPSAFVRGVLAVLISSALLSLVA